MGPEFTGVESFFFYAKSVFILFISLPGGMAKRPITFIRSVFGLWFHPPAIVPHISTINEAA